MLALSHAVVHVADAIAATASVQERKERLAVQYEATAADLEREQLLNESMKLSCAALEALKSQKDMVVEVLQAAVADDQPVLAKGQCQSPGQHLQVRVRAAPGRLAKDWISELVARP